MVVRNTLPGEIVWIGASDVDREGEWVWTYGDGSKRNIAVSIPWAPSQPDGGKEQNCIRMNGRGEFLDVRCTLTGYFHCQITKKGN